MNSGTFKNYCQKTIHLQNIFNIDMCKQYAILNNPQGFYALKHNQSALNDKILSTEIDINYTFQNKKIKKSNFNLKSLSYNILK